MATATAPVDATPAPSNVVVVPPEVEVKVPGSIVYAKAGNIWVQTGKDAKQLTTGGDDSMPSWSPDGTVHLLHPDDRRHRPLAGRRASCATTR